MSPKSEVKVVTRTKCPFCRALLLLDEQREETWHALPVCAQWLQYCEESGAQSLGEQCAEVIAGGNESPPSTAK